MHLAAKQAQDVGKTGFPVKPECDFSGPAAPICIDDLRFFAPGKINHRGRIEVFKLKNRHVFDAKYPRIGGITGGLASERRHSYAISVSGQPTHLMKEVGSVKIRPRHNNEQYVHVA